MHTDNAACSGCHNLIDGLGFGLEEYDGIGRFRTMDQGVKVDSTGTITATTDINGNYEGGAELTPSGWQRRGPRLRSDAVVPLLPGPARRDRGRLLAGRSAGGIRKLERRSERARGRPDSDRSVLAVPEGGVRT
jgi:hypothetical protein